MKYYRWKPSHLFILYIVLLPKQCKHGKARASKQTLCTEDRAIPYLWYFITIQVGLDTAVMHRRWWLCNAFRSISKERVHPAGVQCCLYLPVMVGKYSTSSDDRPCCWNATRNRPTSPSWWPHSAAVTLASSSAMTCTNRPWAMLISVSSKTT